MYALHIIEPDCDGRKHRVIFVETRAQRDKMVAFVNENADGFCEFKRRNPGAIVPSCFYWCPGTFAEPITMKQAREFIGGDDPIFEHDGWSPAYNYTPCTVYEFKIIPGKTRYGWKDGRHYYERKAA